MATNLLSRTPQRIPVRIPAWLLVLSLSVAFWIPEASAQQRTLSLNHKRIQIERLVTQIGEATGRTILFDEQVRGIVSIVTKRTVTLDEAWTILDTSLSLLGFSLLPSTEGNWRIAKIARAVGESPFVEEVGGGAVGLANDAFVTTLIPLREADVREVLAVLEPLSGTRVTLVPYPRSNSLIASGPQRAIARLTTVADELDRIEELDLRLRVLRYRGIADVEPLVEAHLAARGVSERWLQVWTDSRTNAVVFRGRASESGRLAEFLDRIDRPIDGEGEIRILRVLHRDPEEMAEMIRSLSTGSPGASGRASGAAATAESRTQLAGEDFSIAVDKASRSLVVRASPQAHRAIREALGILDERQQLIAIDITVSELRTPRNFSLGFAFHIPLTPGDDADELVGRLISTPGGGGLLAQPSQSTRLFGRVARDAGVPFTLDDGSEIQIPIEDTGVIEGGELRARTEVLIQPSLIVTSGEEHEIFVGDNIPIPVTEEGGIVESDSGAVTTTTGTHLSRSTRFDREDVGIRLTIEAHSGKEAKIQLDLDIEISSVDPVSLAGDVREVGPTLIKQNLVATARLDDGETALMVVDQETREIEGEVGTPFLSQIPFFGWFFKRAAERQVDTRLVIAARARRVSTPAELVADTIRRRLAFQRRNARDATLPSGADSPYGVRVTTREREDDAEAIAEGFAIQGHRTEVHRWVQGSDERYDVYIISLDSMADAAEIARVLGDEGWQADLVVLSTRS